MKLSDDGTVLLKVTEDDIQSDGSFTVPDGVTSIGKGAFFRCRGLKQITLPDKLRSIGDNAFFGCEHLKQIKLPHGISRIGDSAFRNCKELKQISLPDGLENIGVLTFAGCMSLTQVMLPNGLKNIEHRAFVDCISLTQITLPDELTSIEGQAFMGSGLDQIRIDTDNQENFTRMTGLIPEEFREVVLPIARVKEIREIQQHAINQILTHPETSKLYIFQRDQPFSSLPPDMYSFVSQFLLDENPYAKKLIWQMEQVAFPNSKDDMSRYQSDIEKIKNSFLSEIKDLLSNKKDLFTQPRGTKKVDNDKGSEIVEKDNAEISAMQSTKQTFFRPGMIEKVELNEESKVQEEDSRKDKGKSL